MPATERAASAAGLPFIPERLSRRRNAVLFWGFGASGLAALVYEVVWQRELSNTIGGNVYSISILLAAFMAGLAIGGKSGGRLLTHDRDHVKVFGLIELVLGVLGLVVFYIINHLQPVYGQLFYLLRENLTLFYTAQMALVFLVFLVPTTFMGATLPVIMEAWSLRVKEVGRSSGDVYSVNTWGAMAGSLLAGFVLVPLLGLRMANLSAALINFAIAVVALSLSRSRQWLAPAALLIIGVVWLAFLRGPEGVRFNFGLADHYQSWEEFQTRTSGFVRLFDKEAPHGRVQVFQAPSSAAGPGEIGLVSGGRFEGSNGRDAMTMKMLAYLPLAVKADSRSWLNVGLGTGRTVATAASNGRLEKIDSVEINPVIYEAVDKFFYPGLFDDRRVRRITDDGRHYISYTDRRYDVITSQPSYPTRKSVAHLFTKEYYEIAAGKLNAGGVFIQWLPKYLLDDRQLKIAMKTVVMVFPETYAWQFGPDDIYLVALKSGRPLRVDDIETRLTALDPAARAVLLGGPSELAALVRDPAVAVNTDDLPHIEFSAARNKVTGIKQPVNK